MNGNFIRRNIPNTAEIDVTIKKINWLTVWHWCFRNHTYEYWQNVIFCDEKTFRSDQHGRLHCWRRRGTRYQTENINITHHSGHVCLNMFGWSWSGGVGELTKIDCRFNGKERNIIEKNIFQYFYSIIGYRHSYFRIFNVKIYCKLSKLVQYIRDASVHCLKGCDAWNLLSK